MSMLRGLLKTLCRLLKVSRIAWNLWYLVELRRNGSIGSLDLDSTSLNVQETDLTIVSMASQQARNHSF